MATWNGAPPPPGGAGGFADTPARAEQMNRTVSQLGNRSDWARQDWSSNMLLGNALEQMAKQRAAEMQATTNRFSAQAFAPDQRYDGFNVNMTDQYSRANAFGDQQMALAQALMAQANGTGGPTMAQMQLQRATDQNMAQTGGMLAAQRGLNPALGARMVLNQRAAMQQGAAGQSAMLALDEQNAARQQLAQVLAQGRGQSMDAFGINGQLMGQQNALILQSQMEAQRLNHTTAGQNQQAALYRIGAQDAREAARQARQDRMTGAVIGGAGAAIGTIFPAMRPAAAAVTPVAQEAAAQSNDAPTESPQMYAEGGIIQGGPVPGVAPVPGDSYANDTVPAVLSPGEIVIPRSIAQAPDAPVRAATFVEALRQQEQVKQSDGGYGVFVNKLRELNQRLGKYTTLEPGSVMDPDYSPTLESVKKSARSAVEFGQQIPGMIAGMVAPTAGTPGAAGISWLRSKAYGTPQEEEFARYNAEAANPTVEEFAQGFAGGIKMKGPKGLRGKSPKINIELGENEMTAAQLAKFEQGVKAQGAGSVRSALASNIEAELASKGFKGYDSMDKNGFGWERAVAQLPPEVRKSFDALSEQQKNRIISAAEKAAMGEEAYKYFKGSESNYDVAEGLYKKSKSPAADAGATDLAAMERGLDRPGLPAPEQAFQEQYSRLQKFGRVGDEAGAVSEAELRNEAAERAMRVMFGEGADTFSPKYQQYRRELFDFAHGVKKSTDRGSLRGKSKK